MPVWWPHSVGWPRPARVEPTTNDDWPRRARTAYNYGPVRIMEDAIRQGVAAKTADLRTIAERNGWPPCPIVTGPCQPR